MSQLMAGAKLVCEGVKRLEALMNEPHHIDWDCRLVEYLAGMKEQDDKETTQRNKRMFISGWIEWLKERNATPTTQRLRSYLNEKSRKTPLKKGSYYTIGRSIRDFCN